MENQMRGAAAANAAVANAAEMQAHLYRKYGLLPPQLMTRPPMAINNASSPHTVMSPSEGSQRVSVFEL